MAWEVTRETTVACSLIWGRIPKERDHGGRRRTLGVVLSSPPLAGFLRGAPGKPLWKSHFICLVDNLFLTFQVSPMPVIYITTPSTFQARHLSHPWLLPFLHSFIPTYQEIPSLTPNTFPWLIICPLLTISIHSLSPIFTVICLETTMIF